MVPSSSCQSSIAPQLDVALHAHLPSPSWDFIWLELAQVLCILYLDYCEFLCAAALPYPENTFLQSSNTLESYHLSAPSSAMIPETWEDRV